MVTGTLRQILMQHYADPDHVEDAVLRDYLEENGAWTPGTDTGLYIESLARWRPELTEMRPAIVLKEGDWSWRRVGIGDYAGADYRSGAESYSGLWTGSHVVFALGGEGAETQNLAYETAKVLTYLSPLIVDELGLHRFVPVKIGALQALKESTENYVVPVSFAYVAEESWSLQPDAPRLKRIVFDVNEMLNW